MRYRPGFYQGFANPTHVSICSRRLYFSSVWSDCSRKKPLNILFKWCCLLRAFRLILMCWGRFGRLIVRQHKDARGNTISMQGSQDYLLHMIKEAMVKWAFAAPSGLLLRRPSSRLKWSWVPHLPGQTLNTSVSTEWTRIGPVCLDSGHIW